jgi:DNA invertase Pin-like site-specific DNA recombinase
MPGQTIGYIRVSTVEQNTSRQLDGIKVDTVFTDKCSGKDTNRPELEELLKFIRKGDTLVVHSMDRLARNLDDLRKLVNRLTSQKIKVHFIKENLIFSNEDNPMANLMLSVMGAFAEFERALIKERQREGIELAKKAGKFKGRRKSLTDEQIIELKNMLEQGIKKTEIAKKFGIGRRTVYDYLKHPLINNTENKASTQKSIKLLLHLYIENNSKFVRGKKKTREQIEDFCLGEYLLEKINDTEYYVTIPYEEEKELEETINYLLQDMWHTSDSNSCYTETYFCTLDKEKFWE